MNTDDTNQLKFADVQSYFSGSEEGSRLMEILLESAYLLGCAGKYEDAESCFRGILAAQPELIGGRLGLGNILLMQGKTDSSEIEYMKILQHDPLDPAARAFLGELYLCTGRICEGREILESVYWDSPESYVGNWAWNLLQLSREVA
ncbi:hypothetical protein K8T06_10250 [bacterium]|nr:hypothetical protein [bacterium]